jgi:hypothetical protein
MDVEINNEIYNLHIINKDNYNLYEDYLDNIEICDVQFISNLYEKLSYNSLESENYIGFFLSNLANSIIYISCIIDLNCSGIENINMNINNAVEITLLCANNEHRTIGLTKTFFGLILHQYIPAFKPNANNILLRVAQGINNKKAFQFYSKLGFQSIFGNIMEYKYFNAEAKGGKKKTRTRKSKKRRKSQKHNKSK